MNIESYSSVISSHFEIVRGLNVLEVGPFHGLHTKIMQQYDPVSVTLVEPNIRAAVSLKNQFPEHTVELDDIFHYLKDPKKFDVVVCCGVLYHLHSPLHLLELIANNARPQYIILETFLRDNIFYNEEVPNVPGNRYSLNGWKNVGFNIAISEGVLKKSMSQLGYQLLKETYHSKNDNSDDFYKTKECTTTLLWQKIQ